MGAPCKHRCLKLGKATRRTSVLLKRHSIIVRGATARRGSANTPKRWKPRRLHNVWRSNHAPMFVRRASPATALKDAGTIGAAGYAERISGEIRGNHQCAGGEGV